MDTRLGLVARIGLSAGAACAAAILAIGLLLSWLGVDARVTIAACAVAGAAAAGLAIRAQMQPVLALFRALGGTVIAYRDGDYSFGVHWPRSDEIGELVQSHNALGQVLREQRIGLVQRELLLDTMVQNTPVAMLLVQDAGNIIFANVAARQLLNNGKRLDGMTLDQVLRRAFASLREALQHGGDGLFTVSHQGGDDAEDETYHLARREFTLNGRKHELLLLRQLTAELRRQEVQTWKKVIRVISHELNNSLAPVASLASSASQLVKRGQVERLPEILSTVEERARHLERFIEGYARFAKLPAPRKERVEWTAFVQSMQMQVPFKVDGALPGTAASFDASQMQQAVINLLKNAHESGSPAQEISLAVRRAAGNMVAIEVCDRGSGMSETVMSNALVPFYSTKRSGTGLGLALAREIVEAHDGRIALNNREGGGLAVTLLFPAGGMAATG